ncbi:hypothetical protein G7Y89_g2931 [Cudoniella acicularis]|uniref:C2H2-type domain-containing protein n=1 Tax=Cudoniella acicularis TaxID=354080 RepID=A0A8H4W624_9HELO|nr:hypothetical protein G7Y89_g2931 [Cudoniella acicularis]
MDFNLCFDNPMADNIPGSLFAMESDDSHNSSASPGWTDTSKSPAIPSNMFWKSFAIEGVGDGATGNEDAHHQCPKDFRSWSAQLDDPLELQVLDNIQTFLHETDVPENDTFMGSVLTTTCPADTTGLPMPFSTLQKPFIEPRPLDTQPQRLDCTSARIEASSLATKHSNFPSKPVRLRNSNPRSLLQGSEKTARSRRERKRGNVSSKSASAYKINPIKNKKMRNCVTPGRALASLKASLDLYQSPLPQVQSKVAVLLRHLDQVIEDHYWQIDLDAELDEVASTTASSFSRIPSSSSMSIPDDDDTNGTSISSATHQDFDMLNSNSLPLEKEQSSTRPDKSRHTFPCTMEGCSWSFKSFGDWKRHEETTHWPQESFMCLHCTTLELNQDGNVVCEFCQQPSLIMNSSVQDHYLHCADAQSRANIFPRKDKLSKHLQGRHAIKASEANDLSKNWGFSINSNWPRECAYCTTSFQTWDERMRHIPIHFRSQDHQPKGPSHRHDGDGSDDDDDDDFPDSHYPSRKEIPGSRRGRPKSSRNRTQHDSSMRQRDYSSRQPHNRRSESHTLLHEQLDHSCPAPSTRRTLGVTLQRWLNDTDDQTIDPLNTLLEDSFFDNALLEKAIRLASQIEAFSEPSTLQTEKTSDCESPKHRNPYLMNNLHFVILILLPFLWEIALFQPMFQWLSFIEVHAMWLYQLLRQPASTLEGQDPWLFTHRQPFAPHWASTIVRNLPALPIWMTMFHSDSEILRLHELLFSINCTSLQITAYHYALAPSCATSGIEDVDRSSTTNIGRSDSTYLLLFTKLEYHDPLDSITTNSVSVLVLVIRFNELCNLLKAFRF